jgi:hypothetical protein
MNGNVASSMKLIRDLLDMLDARIEDALTAHGFSFSALSADEQGASMRFDQPGGEAGDTWQLTFRLPWPGQPELHLLRGDPRAAEVSLRLKVDGRAVGSLAEALAQCMGLFTAIEQT